MSVSFILVPSSENSIYIGFIPLLIKNGEMANFRTGAKKIQMSLKHLGAPKSKDMLKEWWGHIKRTQEPV